MSGSVLIRQARERAGLTQSALAERSGIVQSVISAYEKGRRDPSTSALERLIGAAGLSLTLTEAPPALRALRLRGDALRRLLADFGASNVEVFGSVARGDDGPDSDVDLLVDFAPTVGMFDIVRMQAAAEALLERPVDIVPRGELKGEVAEAVLREAVPL